MIYDWEKPFSDSFSLGFNHCFEFAVSGISNKAGKVLLNALCGIHLPNGHFLKQTFLSFKISCNALKRNDEICRKSRSVIAVSI